MNYTFKYSWSNALIGKRFGKLTIVKLHIKRKNEQHRALKVVCKCDCGKVIKPKLTYLYDRNQRSCGCERLEKITKHGYHKSKLYKTWNSMLHRCNDKHGKDYKNYGGRGIKVCEQWHNFINFRNDMFKKHILASIKYKGEKLSIERVNNNGWYSSKNCIFIPSNNQSKNRRNVIPIIAINTKTKEKVIGKNQKELSKLLKVTNTSINNCLHGRAKRSGNWTFKINA
jgi:hypothetical protein